ncbi:MAG: asparagine--tRNA ligase [Treponema sp.]|jgi:asparaginyl-tRNA synthetase|nr:asparagine--tRNA ligase [Treponema sp.]
MRAKLVKDILSESPLSQEVKVSGWVRTKRDMKNLVFVEVNDGSCFAGIQCTFDLSRGETASSHAALAALNTGASIEIFGHLVASPASGQAVEIAADSLRLIGEAPSENRTADVPYLEIPAYPLQKKRHSLEFLREIAHLRPRTNTFGAVARVRSRMSFAIHQYFQERGFQYIHTPIITAGDAEGAGAMFQVTTFNIDALAKGRNRETGVNYAKDFFGKKTYLTVSGQLEAETYATALSRVYTFGPTFRAENSNTARHLAEFWMIEPEMAFAGLEDDMALAEDFLKYIFNTALENCASDLAFFDSHIEKGIIETLTHVVNSRFAHISYTDAIAELEKAAAANAGLFEFAPHWGCDLQSEHEKYLTEKTAGGPVIVTDYPKEIKAFYMKLNDDGKTVRAMDVLVPRLGEIIGGSQREDDLEKLCKRMLDLGMNIEDYGWYLDLRRYGTVPHSGFGLGFERLILYITGMANIRDVIPYPRAVGQANF